MIDEEKVPVAPRDREEVRARQKRGEPLGLLQKNLGTGAVLAEEVVRHARPEPNLVVEPPDPFARDAGRPRERPDVDLRCREVRSESEQLAPRAGPPFGTRDLDGNPIATATFPHLP